MNPTERSNPLASVLAPVAWLYCLAIRARNRRYDRGRGVQSGGVPTISVGNLTTGGTGKTPMVIEIARRVRALGRRPAILTRGYAAAAGQTPDEVQEFQELLPDVPVVVNPDRVVGAATARETHGADCLVLDDGFQHRRLGRDLDIVLIDALNPWGGRRLLPAGRLREPIDGLRRAGFVVVTRANQVKPDYVDAVCRELSEFVPAERLAVAGVAADSLLTVSGDRKPAVRTLLRSAVVGVCGIGNPDTFLQSLVDCGARPHLVEFPDHHRYSRGDLERIMTAVLRSRAEWVVTTRKDWGKLREVWPAPPEAPPLLRLDVQISWLDGEARFDAAVQSALRNPAASCATPRGV